MSIEKESPEEEAKKTAAKDEETEEKIVTYTLDESEIEKIRKNSIQSRRAYQTTQVLRKEDVMEIQKSSAKDLEDILDDNEE